MSEGRNAAILGVLTDLVSFLRWRIGAPTSDEFVGAALAADPDHLAAAVAATAAGRATEDLQVAASLWWQAYSYRVAGTTLGCWVVSGAAPDPSAAGTSVGVSRARPSTVIYDPSAATIVDIGELVEALFAGHLDPVARSLRLRHSLGGALITGNTAASIESVLGTVGSAPGASDLSQRAARMHAALPAAVAASVVVRPDGVRRTTCCLWWKTTEADGRLCADCSLR